MRLHRPDADLLDLTEPEGGWCQPVTIAAMIHFGRVMFLADPVTLGKWVRITSVGLSEHCDDVIITCAGGTRYGARYTNAIHCRAERTGTRS